MTLLFNPEDPAPLLDDSRLTYATQKEHSLIVDQWLGVRAQEIESKLKPIEGEELWVGLDVSSLQTPYTEIRQIHALLNLREGSSIVDLGSGYGRMGFVVGFYYPELRFFGFEKVRERLLEGERVQKRFGFKNVHYSIQDLAAAEFQLPKFDAYFLYDFGTKDAIRKILSQIQARAKTGKVQVVGRGRASRDLIEQENPWLSQVVEPAHYSNFSIYRSA